jgi:O-antigen/teichoic acid export membrane protein
VLGLNSAGLIFRRTRTPVGGFAGFGLSAVLLAGASLAATPAMVAADGPAAWGAIALGQAVGAIASLVVSYGWAVSGPSAIARGNATAQRREYADSIRVKLALLFPGAASAALVAAVLGPHDASFAVVGAISTTAVALTSSWYFAGLARPYMWLLLETLPRVCGTAVGIVLMTLGYSAIVGLACTSSGMVVAFIFVTTWVYRSTARAGADRLPGGKLTELFASRRHGIASMVGSQLFLSAPLATISVISPTAQPVFALVDKVRQLISAGLNPVIVVLQGWVPHGAELEHGKRARVALSATGGLGVVLCGMFLVAAPSLMHWLGNGQIAVPQSMVILTAMVIALGLFDSVLAYAVMASLGRLEIVSRATAASIIVMLPVVAIGTLHFGAIGALVGTILGLLVRVGIELAGAVRATTTAWMRPVMERGSGYEDVCM